MLERERSKWVREDAERVARTRARTSTAARVGQRIAWWETFRCNECSKQRVGVWSKGSVKGGSVKGGSVKPY